MPKFRKKPVIISAVQWTGTNKSEMLRHVKSSSLPVTFDKPEKGKLTILTLEGEMIASKSDWIIKGVHGEIYPCKPEIFRETYEVI